MSNKDSNCHCAHLDEFSRETKENFTVIKESLNNLEERMDKKFSQLEEWLEKIARNMTLLLDMHGSRKTSIRYQNATLSDHERRIYKLQHQNS